MPGPAKQLTTRQMKFAQLIVYGVEGSPITKTEAARLAGYSSEYPASLAASVLVIGLPSTP